MDPVNPSPTPVRDPVSLTETLRWPLLVISAELAVVMVNDEGETYTMTTRVSFKADDEDIVITEVNPFDPQLGTAPVLSQPSRYWLELKGEMVPEEDHTVYRIELGDPRE